ncbi:MAG TPA: DUF2157 domain-containing protein [Acidimicrobiia bacterium]
MGTAGDLERWVEAGLIDRKTAGAIQTYESQRSGSASIGRGMEAIAYLGAVLVLIALGVLAAEFWDRLVPWGRFALGLAVTLILLLVGLVFARAEEPAVERAQMFAWFLTVPAAALTAYVVVGELADADDPDTFVWVSLISLAAAFALWWMRHSALQTIAMGAASGVSVVALVSLSDSPPDWAYGLSLAGLGMVWLLLTWGGLLRPARTSYVVAAVGMLCVGLPDASEPPWPFLGLAAGLALMALSVPLNHAVLLGMGVAGLFVYIPITVFEVFGETLGVPVALLITGLILLGVVVVTARLRKRS